MFEALIKGQLGLGLKLLESHVEKLGDAQLKSRYESLSQDYTYMLRFLMDGYKDPERGKLHDEMLAKAFHLASDIKRAQMISADSALLSLQKNIETADCSAAELIDALRDELLDAKAHYEILSRAFTSIFLSSDWREQEQRLWTAYLISTDVKPTDAQVVVSAIMLGCMLGYCVEKYKTLCYVFMTSDVMEVKERALVGWVLCYHQEKDLLPRDFLAQNTLVEQMLEDENTASEVVELIMQAIKCTEAEKDNLVIQQEIMPDILKGNPMKFTAKDGIVEKDDSMDDILNPGASELAMEKMEQGIQRMSKMQKAGADIFYSGFSQMKRYPFFYKLTNWFVPFDLKHPDLGDSIQDDDSFMAMANILKAPTLCSSDKYSFLFALKSVLPTFPEEVRKAMAQGEMSLVGMTETTDSIIQQPVYIRRMYLQDLYRFFKLSPQVKMPNLFANTPWMIGLFDSIKALNGRSVEVAKFLLRHQMGKLACEVIKNSEKSEERYVVLAALAENVKMDPSRYYHEALKYNPDSIPALRGLARCLLQKGDAEAADYYKRLCELCPGVFAYDLNRLHSNVIAGKAEECLNDIYRLDFEHADDPKVKRLIAWTLLCLGRFEKAEDQYNKILECKWGEVTRNDFLSVIDLYFFSGDMKKCIEACYNYIDAYPLKGDLLEYKWNDFYSILTDEFQLLKQYHTFDPAEVSLLVDAVLS